jgi:hypothetical protein
MGLWVAMVFPSVCYTFSNTRKPSHHTPVIFRLSSHQSGQQGVESVPFTAFIFGVFQINVKGDLAKISQNNFFLPQNAQK